MWRWTYSTDVVCGLSGAANPCNKETNLANLMKLRVSCHETLGSAILMSPCNEEPNSINFVVRHWILRVYEFLQWSVLETSCNKTMDAE